MNPMFQPKKLINPQANQASAQHSKRGVVIFLVVLTVIISGYIAYTLYYKPQVESDLVSQQTMVTSSKVVTNLPVQILANPQVQDLNKLRYTEYVDQTEGVVEHYPEPTQPININIQDTTLGNSIFISWELPPNESYDGVEIFRSTNKHSSDEPIVTINQSSGTYTDAELDNTKNYYYQIRSYRKIKQDMYYSPLTDFIVATPTDTTPPSSPTNIQVTTDPENLTALVITWQNSSEQDIKVNRIYRSTISGEIGTLLKEVNASTDQLVDKTIEPGVVYYYTVTASDGSGNESTHRLPVAPSGNSNPFVEPITQ